MTSTRSLYGPLRGRARPLRAGAWIAPLMLLTSACSGIDEFEQTIEDEATIPFTEMATGPFTASFGGGGFSNVNLSTAREFQNNGVEPGDVDAIYLKSATVEISTGAPSPTLSGFVESIELFVQSPGLPKTVVARKAMTPMAATTTLDITPGDMLPGVNLKPYATADSMSFGADLQLRPVRQVNATLKTTIVLLVDINLLGI